MKRVLSVQQTSNYFHFCCSSTIKIIVPVQWYFVPKSKLNLVKCTKCLKLRVVTWFSVKHYQLFKISLIVWGQIIIIIIIIMIVIIIMTIIIILPTFSIVVGTSVLLFRKTTNQIKQNQVKSMLVFELRKEVISYCNTKRKT